jgi:hypothetical protein
MMISGQEDGNTTAAGTPRVNDCDTRRLQQQATARGTAIFNGIPIPRVAWILLFPRFRSVCSTGFPGVEESILTSVRVLL